MEIKRRADSEHDRNFEGGTMRLNPEFLFRTAETDPHEICPGIVDLLDYRGVFLRSERTERRGVSARNDDCGKLFPQFPLQSLQFRACGYKQLNVQNSDDVVDVFHRNL